MKKKVLRAGALVLMACLMLACFSGCSSMDEYKARHAIWGDEDQNSILWQGEEYVYLYQESYSETSYSPVDDWSKAVFVTEPDVPTLLASNFGFYVGVSVNETYLVCNSLVFCKADRYETLKAAIDAGLQTDQYGYTYYDSETDEQKVRIFTEEESEQLGNIIEEVTSNPMEVYPENCWYVCEIQHCYADTELMRYAGVDLMQSENGYYLEYVVEVEPTEEELKEMYGEDWKDVDWVEEEWVTCPIPAEYNEVIEEWFAPVLEDPSQFYETTTEYVYD